MNLKKTNFEKNFRKIFEEQWDNEGNLNLFLTNIWKKYLEVTIALKRYLNQFFDRLLQGRGASNIMPFKSTSIIAGVTSYGIALINL